MLENHLLNPSVQGAVPAVIQIFCTLLFSGIFLFLRRHSGVVYFRFWSLAWGIESLALLCGYTANWTGYPVFLWIRALLEFAFAVALLTASRSAAGPATPGLRSSLRSMSLILLLAMLYYVFVGLLPLP